MKTYLTEYTAADGSKFAGKQIEADSWTSAEAIAAADGLTVVGSLT